MSGYIDTWCNIFTHEGMRRYFIEPETIRFAFQLFNREDRLVGKDVPEFMAYLDENGFDKVVVPSFKVKEYRGPMVQDCSVSEVAKLVEMEPDRIVGLVGINPYGDIMGTVRELESGVREHNFRGAHIHPYGFGFNLSDAIYYPIYAKCSELNVPVFMQVGHSAEKMPSETGHPLLLDRIALDFPDLKIVGMHTGWPWTETLVAMAWKHPNVFIGTSAHAPKYWEESLIRFINTRGKNKVVFGSDYPVLNQEECIAQVKDLNLRPEAFENLMRNNALNVLGLES